MRFKKVSLLAAALCLSTFAMYSCNNDGKGDHDMNDSTEVTDADMRLDNNNGMSERDQDFVTDVLEENAKEMAWLRAGMNMGTDAQLKADAQHMMTDHEKMDKDMKAYAAKKNIDLSNLDTTVTVDLNESKGNDWDEEWADEMEDKHEALVKKFEKAENKVHDAELKTMITSTLPTLRSHLDMARKLDDKLEKK